MYGFSLYKFVQFVFIPVLSVFYKLKVHGLENLPSDGRIILCSNHISNLDPVFLGMIVKRQIFFMAKEELFRFKFFGNFLKKLGAFPVKRGKGDVSALNNAKKILSNGNILGIFIEGTRSKTGELLKPKPGAAMLSQATASRVIPVCIKTSNNKKVRFFSKIYISFGKVVEFSDLGLTGENSNKCIRDASRLIMQRIAELKNEKI